MSKQNVKRNRYYIDAMLMLRRWGRRRRTWCAGRRKRAVFQVNLVLPGSVAAGDVQRKGEQLRTPAGYNLLVTEDARCFAGNFISRDISSRNGRCGDIRLDHFELCVLRHSQQRIRDLAHTEPIQDYYRGCLCSSDWGNRGNRRASRCPTRGNSRAAARSARRRGSISGLRQRRHRGLSRRKAADGYQRQDQRAEQECF